jgi:hypothetical protein
MNVAAPASQVSVSELERSVAPLVVHTAALVSTEIGFRDALAPTE